MKWIFLPSLISGAQKIRFFTNSHSGSAHIKDHLARGNSFTLIIYLYTTFKIIQFPKSADLSDLRKGDLLVRIISDL